MSFIQIPSLDGSVFEAYAAAPPNSSGPGLIVIHDVTGLSPSMHKTCDTFASFGFSVFCPNLFWREPKQKGMDESDKTPDREKSFNIETGVHDLLSTLAFVRRHPSCTGKVGALGFCLGSRLAFLLAARSEIDCSVGFYGAGLDALLDEVYDIRMPLLLHFGEEDELLPPPTKRKILNALEKNNVINVCSYPKAGHGFACEEAPGYQKESAETATTRTKEFLQKHLFD